MLKKIILSLAIILSVLTVTVPKAQAGLIVGAIAGAPVAGLAIGTVVGAITGGILPSITDPMANLDDLQDLLILVGSIGGAILDAEAALTQDQLALAFQKQYPFIDNSEALSNLASAVKEKVLAEAQTNPEAKSAYISLSREEVATALETADISQEQFEQIASDLK